MRADSTNQGTAITTLQHHTGLNVRHNLVELKWTIEEAIRAGNTLEQVAQHMGKPWSDVLILEAFPDIARKYRLAPSLSGKNMPRI